MDKQNPYEPPAVARRPKERGKPTGRNDSMTFVVGVLLVLIALAPFLLVAGYLLAMMLGPLPDEFE